MQTRTDLAAIQDFAALLDWHLERGTRPSGAPESKGAPWANKEFANEIGKVKRVQGPNERTIRNWRNGDTLPEPSDFAAIPRALFGGKPEYTAWQNDLTEKYHARRAHNQDELTGDRRQTFNISLPIKPPRCLGRDEDLAAVVQALTAKTELYGCFDSRRPRHGKNDADPASRE